MKISLASKIFNSSLTFYWHASTGNPRPFLISTKKID